MRPGRGYKNVVANKGPAWTYEKNCRVGDLIYLKVSEILVTCRAVTERWHSVIIILAGLFCLTGCSRPDYKEQADEQVYKIIDQKWRADFGQKVNYRISDTEPSPNDVKIRTNAVPQVLTLPHAVALATANNREYQLQKEDLYVMALDLRLVRHDFETQFFGGPSGGYAADRNDDLFRFEANFGFNRLLAHGTRISTQLTAAWVEVLTGNLRSGLASVLSVAVTQPLLRGSERDVVLENLTQAERDTLYQIRLFNHFRKTFVVSIITQYYRVLQLSDAAANAKDNYNTVWRVQEHAAQLAEAGRLPTLEVQRAEQEKLQAYDAYIQEDKAYRQALDEFKIVLSLPATTEFRLDKSALDELREAMGTSPAFSEQQAIETAFYRRLDLANSADAVLDAERKVHVAADGLRADLNFVGTVNAPTAKKGDGRTLKSLRAEYGADLELNLPFDRVTEQNIYRKAMITLSRTQRDYEQAADTVKLEVRNGYRDLTEAFERYKVQLDSLELARKRLANTSLLMQYGRASSRRVLRAQRDLLDARDAATAALVDYTVAALDFYRDTGVLHVRADGMWEQETFSSASGRP